jgi:hypothetical protein
VTRSPKAIDRSALEFLIQGTQEGMTHPLQTVDGYCVAMREQELEMDARVRGHDDRA